MQVYVNAIWAYYACTFASAEWFALLKPRKK